MSNVGRIVTIAPDNMKMTMLNRERMDKSCQTKVSKSQKFLFVCSLVLPEAESRKHGFKLCSNGQHKRGKDIPLLWRILL